MGGIANRRDGFCFGRGIEYRIGYKSLEWSDHPEQLHGVVTDISQVGTRVLVSVDVGSVLIAEITAKAMLDLQLAPGMEVYCLVKTQSLRPLALSN